MPRHLVAFLVLAACSPGAIDDCQPPPFADAAIAGGLQGTAAAPFVAVEWSASSGDLPDAYFAKATVSPATLARGVSFVSPRELDVQLVALSQLPANQDVVVTVALPDTRDFTSCRHPGMADVYSFTVVLRFDASHALTESNVTPIVRIAGAI